MTREDAIKRLKEFIILHTEQHGWDVTTLKALDMAIKALEQEPILDKISEEVDDLRNYSYLFTDMIFDEVQRVIDKYKEDEG